MIKITNNIKGLKYELKLPMRKWKGIVVATLNRIVPDDYHVGNDLESIYSERTKYGMPAHLLINRDGKIEFSIRWRYQTQSYILRGFNYKYLSIMCSFDPSGEEMPKPVQDSLKNIIEYVNKEIFNAEKIKVFQFSKEVVDNMGVNNKTKKPYGIEDYLIIPTFAFIDSHYYNLDKIINGEKDNEDS